jgi:hypothetical protein
MIKEKKEKKEFSLQQANMDDDWRPVIAVRRWPNSAAPTKNNTAEATAPRPP